MPPDTSSVEPAGAPTSVNDDAGAVPTPETSAHREPSWTPETDTVTGAVAASDFTLSAAVAPGPATEMVEFFASVSAPPIVAVPDPACGSESVAPPFTVTLPVPVLLPALTARVAPEPTVTGFAVSDALSITSRPPPTTEIEPPSPLSLPVAVTV